VVYEVIALRRVRYIPRTLEQGLLYVSEEFAVAAHLCACGCGNKVVTPLGPAEWAVSERNGVPTLHPSIGNWQLPCRSHYLIIDGRIRWARQWSDAEIAAGRQSEERRRRAYYAGLDQEPRVWVRIGKWIMRLLFGG
jgi:hypothetical protein